MLESDVPRDNRMGWRRLSVRGSLRAPSPITQAIQDNQSYPPMPGKLQGFGGQSPRLQTDIFPEQLADIIAEQ